MSLKVYINGKLMPQEEAKVSVFDHGLLYGDGIFEGLRAYHGRVFKLTQHLERLFDSARAIFLEIPMTIDELKEGIFATLRANNMKDSYVRLIVTRGEGKLGLEPGKCRNPQVIIITDTLQLYPPKLYNEGIDIVAVATVRNHPEALNPRIKCLNYMNNILAKTEGINAGATEALMLNKDGFVAECTGQNIFMVKGNELYTPHPNSGILKGITRDTVIGLAKEAGIKVREDFLTRYDLYLAEECFLTGTAAQIVPVVKVDARIVGDGKPGRITREMLRKYRELLTNPEVSEVFETLEPGYSRS
ncbi:MAG: branched-chain-amino-acid transaminase [Candidatus Brocadiales bacterium]|nr:branched-chain-amino-acid transaminase [Candidatus Bathyanammoxibius sp.]MCQ4574080.1 branched-chain-amino-acid transaminase [Candidatus Bathyanammoxibius amoris]